MQATLFDLILALKKFCESVLECTSNLAHVKDDSISIDRSTFAGQFAAAYEIFQNTWIQTKDTKVSIDNDKQCID